LIAAGSSVGLERMSGSTFRFLVPLIPGIAVLTWWTMRVEARRVAPTWLRSRFIAALLVLPGPVPGGLLATWGE
jgi:hypothetical protein